ncbi:MAG: hypothetical protein QNL88_00695 [Acidobacteriota bacterium]|nr:hypothetical protein [Acidobacteriota bacterium]
MADAKPANERTRLVVLLTVLVIAAVVAAVRFLGGGGMAGGASGSSELDYRAKNLPPLKIAEGGRSEIGGAESAGNPFAYRAPPTATPNLTPPPTAIPRPTRPPRPTPTPRIAYGVDGQPKPPPPPFDREYIGYLGPRPTLVAAFRKSGTDTTDVEVAMVGDIIDDIYIVRAIGLESVTIGFVGYDVSEDTSVPLSDQ